MKIDLGTSRKLDEAKEKNDTIYPEKIGEVYPAD